MSERLLTVLLSELRLIRLRCRKCGTAVELTIDKLEATAALDRCPHCREDFRVPTPGANTALAQMGAAIRQLQLQQTAGRVDVEFILPQGEPATEAE